MEDVQASVIQELIQQENWEELRRLLEDIPAPEFPSLLWELDESQRIRLYRMLPRALAGEVFSYLDPEQRKSLLEELTNEETSQILADLRPDDRTHLLEELPAEAGRRMLRLLDPEDLRETQALLGYPEESVGRLMTPDYVTVQPGWTIAQALDHIRARGMQSETIDVIYVTGPSHKLLDALDLRDLILAAPASKVEALMDETCVSIPASADREEAVHLMRDYDVFVLPVVDSEGVLLGIVTIDDILDVAELEATEDFQKAGAVAPLGVGYRAAGVWPLYRKRIGWLVMLVLVSLSSSGVIAVFEETLASAMALAFFIPVLIGTAGNAGSQAATLMVRALATNEIELSEWWRALLKDVVVGLCLGVTMGLCGWLLGLLRGGPGIAIVVGLTMMAAVLVANLIGGSLPFVLTHFGLDPAAASGPLITSMMDTIGLLTYFSVAAWLLGLPISG